MGHLKFMLTLSGWAWMLRALLMEMTLNRNGRSPFHRIAPSTCGLSSKISCVRGEQQQQQRTTAANKGEREQIHHDIDGQHIRAEQRRSKSIAGDSNKRQRQD